jgi:cytochrome c oxidase subunit IV
MFDEMSSEEKHITGYDVYAKVMIALLALTTLTILVPWIDLSALTVFIALLIAVTKGGIVMTWFMHLRTEIMLIRVLVIIILLVYVSVILLTFADYLMRAKY